MAVSRSWARKLDRRRGHAVAQIEGQLTGSVAALFQPKLQDAEVAGLLEELQRNGVFVVNGTRVTYALPE